MDKIICIFVLAVVSFSGVSSRLFNRKAYQLESELNLYKTLTDMKFMELSQQMNAIEIDNKILKEELKMIKLKFLNQNVSKYNGIHLLEEIPPTEFPVEIPSTTVIPEDIQNPENNSVTNEYWKNFKSEMQNEFLSMMNSPKWVFRRDIEEETKVYAMKLNGLKYYKISGVLNQTLDKIKNYFEKKYINNSKTLYEDADIGVKVVYLFSEMMDGVFLCQNLTFPNGTFAFAEQAVKEDSSFKFEDFGLKPANFKKGNFEPFGILIETDAENQKSRFEFILNISEKFGKTIPEFVLMALIKEAARKTFKTSFDLDNQD